MKEHTIQLPIADPLMVLEAGRGVALKPYIHEGRTVPFSVLIYILKGRMEIIEDHTTHVLSEGSFFVLKHDVHHWGTVPFEIGTTWFYVHFKHSDPRETSVAYEFENPFLHSHYVTEKAYQRHLTLPKHITLPRPNDSAYATTQQIESLLAAVVDYKENDALIIKSQKLWQLFLLLVERTNFSQKDSITSLQHSRVMALKSFIETKYIEGFHSSDVEALTHCSYKYMATSFKKITGMTIKAYQLQLKLSLSETLLHSTVLSVAQIAEQAGFSDPFFFSKVFKREYGCAPSAYRNLYKPRL